jgi:hypothetical protein
MSSHAVHNHVCYQCIFMCFEQSRPAMQSRNGRRNPVQPYTVPDNQGISPIAASDSVSVLLPNSLAVLAPQPRADVTAVAWRVHPLHQERYSDPADHCAARNKQHTYTQHDTNQHYTNEHNTTLISTWCRYRSITGTCGWLSDVQSSQPGWYLFHASYSPWSPEQPTWRLVRCQSPHPEREICRLL